MWANVETNWAEVSLDPMSLAFIAQVDIFLYFPFFPYFFPLFIHFSIYRLWKVWKGETTLGGARTSTCIQVRWTSSQNMTFVGQNAPLIHLRRFCFVGWWNRIILYFRFFSIRLIQKLCESFLTDPFCSSLFIFQICSKKIQETESDQRSVEWAGRRSWRLWQKHPIAVLGLCYWGISPSAPQSES